MHKYSSLIFCLMVAGSSKTEAQLCRLNAHYEERTSRVMLDWNMITHKAKTTYVLLKSPDEKTWTEAVTDKVFRKYTKEDIFDYEDRINKGQPIFYRLKIIDATNKTIALSNTVAISAQADKSSWVIYPNPVNDVLHLAYQGSNGIKGVINVTVQDISGKIVSRFRAASIYRTLEIPVSTLRNGIYLVQISIMNEVVMNQKFIKQ